MVLIFRYRPACGPGERIRLAKAGRIDLLNEEIPLR